MSRRNLMWLAAIVVIGVGVWIVVGWLWGLIAAVAVLIVSEVVERSRRARLRRQRGAEAVSVRDAIGARRRR